MNRKEPHSVPEVLTEPERAGRSARDAVTAYADSVQDTYTELARCTPQNPPPEALRSRVEGELASLGRAETDLRHAQNRTAELRDELSARLSDTEKSTARKWSRLRPPTNGAIDLAEQERQHFARGLNLYKMLLVLILGSFAGVVVELIWCFVTNGYLESRAGLVYGPFNLLYGVGAAVLSAALYRFRNRGRWLSFLGGFVVGSAVEYGCSWLQEMVFGSTSWDYSHLPFNLNGRICLLYSIFWGLLGVLWIKDIYPRMSKWILRIPNRAGILLTWALTAFLIFDCIVSGIAVMRWSQRIEGVPASNAFETFVDARFPDERMERIYANMDFD